MPASARKRPQVSKVPEPYQTYGPAKMKTVNVSRESHAGGKNRYHTERNVTPSRQSSDHPNSEQIQPPDARIVLQQHPTQPALRLTRLTLYIVDTHIASCASPARALASPLDRAYLSSTRVSRSHTAACARLTLSPPPFRLHQPPPGTHSHTSTYGRAI